MPLAPMPSMRPTPRGRRVWPVLGVVLAVLLLHAALLGLLTQALGGPPPGAAARPLQVRQLLRPPLAGAAAPAAPERARLRPAPGPATESEPEPQSASPSPSPSPSASPLPPLRVRAQAADASTDTALAVPTDKDKDKDNDKDNDALPDALGDAAPTALPAGPPLPTYPTRLPPPATLQYTVQRGGPGASATVAPVRAGLQAQLSWRPDPAAATYTLSFGLGIAGSASVGALDLHGIAPQRHVETRRGREVRAANFQRQPGEGGGRITFSGPRIEHALLPGVQDRLSWMLQLPAVLAADPALAQPGREVTLLVVGVRGDAAPWAFRVLAVQTLPTPAGEVPNAVHLRREAQHAYDTRVDVWLDPARHHLPVRLRLQNRADGPGTEFELLRLTF